MSVEETEVYRALSSKSRIRILKLLYRKPLSVDEIAKSLDLQPITVRHHLQALEEAGFIESYEERKGSVGRPKVIYKVAKKTKLVGFPKRRYLLLSDFMINTLRFMLGKNKAKKVLEKVGIEIGENTAKKIAAEHQIKEWTLDDYKRAFVEKYLAEIGAEPEIIKVSKNKIVYRLHNCLFFELAVKMPEMVCEALHDSFHEGLANVIGGKVKITRVTCIGEGAPYCEHVCEWVTKKE